MTSRSAVPGAAPSGDAPDAPAAPDATPDHEGFREMLLHALGHPDVAERIRALASAAVAQHARNAASRKQAQAR